MQRTQALPDESLAAEVMPPLLIAVGVLAAAAFGILMLAQWRESAWPYLLTGALAASVWGSSALLRRGRLRAAGIVIAYALALLPVGSVAAFGFGGNVVIFLAPLGIFAAGILVSPEEPLRLSWITLLTLIALLTAPFLVGQAYASLGVSLAIALAMALLLFSSAALSWVAGYAVRGTIVWALETSAKSERREQLLRITQSDLELALRERDQLNDRLYGLNLELEAARADAEAAYRSKASFMATMSHELRTPLNIIIGFSTAILDHPQMYDNATLPEAIATDIAEIRRSGKHLLDLINDILDLARVEAGRLELNKLSMPILPLLDETMRTAQGLLKDRPVLLRREYQSPLPNVLADEVRVRQVLLNLISNACKFTSVGEIAVGAKADLYDITIWVRDTGIGIATGDQERIFNQFEQVENADTRQHTGTGLGLSICRWLVELHGGRMWLESELGKGSIFYFTLQRVQPAPGASPRERTAPALRR